MTAPDRRAYELSGGVKDAVALDDRAIEQRVEGRWYACRLPRGALKNLMRRSDRAGLANFAPWMKRRGRLLRLGKLVGRADLLCLRYTLYLQRWSLA